MNSEIIVTIICSVAAAITSIIGYCEYKAWKKNKVEALRHFEVDRKWEEQIKTNHRTVNKITETIALMQQEFEHSRDLYKRDFDKTLDESKQNFKILSELTTSLNNVIATSKILEVKLEAKIESIDKDIKAIKLEVANTKRIVNASAKKK